jgi:hypothetical protein
VRIQNQLEFIDAMLDEATRNCPTWLLVAGHYPIFSMGEHGDTSELQTYLLPLLQKHNVHAYFCGHDHFSGKNEKKCLNVYCLQSKLHGLYQARFIMHGCHSFLWCILLVFDGATLWNQIL